MNNPAAARASGNQQVPSFPRRHHGVAHTFNSWAGMPQVTEQLQLLSRGVPVGDPSM